MATMIEHTMDEAEVIADGLERYSAWVDSQQPDQPAGQPDVFRTAARIIRQQIADVRELGAERERVAEQIGVCPDELDDHAALVWLTGKAYEAMGAISFGVTEPNGQIGVFFSDEEKPRGVGDTVQEAIENAYRAVRATPSEATP